MPETSLRVQLHLIVAAAADQAGLVDHGIGTMLEDGAKGHGVSVILLLVWPYCPA